MRIQLWDKFGNSELVGHKEVQQRLIDGWSYNEPSVLQRKSTKTTRKRNVKKLVKVDEPVVLQTKTNLNLSGPKDLTTTSNNEENL